MHRLSAEIEIGGRLASARVAELCTAIAAANVSWAWGDALFTPESAAELLELVDEAGHLHLYSESARDGEFPGLQACLTRLGLPYNRSAEADGASDAELAAFRPGRALCRLTLGADHEPRVELEAMQQAIAAIEGGRGEVAVATLRAAAGLNLEPLPLFEIEEQTA